MSAIGQADPSAEEDWTREVLERLRLRRIPTILMSMPWSDSGPVDDLRVFVPPSRFDLAVRTLSALGYRESVAPRLRPSFHRSCAEGVRLVRVDHTRIEVAHHVRPWVWGRRLPFEELERAAEVRSLHGMPVHLTRAAHAYLIAALRSITEAGHPDERRAAIAELVELADRSDPQEIARATRAVGLDGVLASVLRTLPTPVQPANILEALGDATASGLDALRLRVIQGESRHPYPLVRALELPAPNAAALLGATLFPSGSFLERRYGSRLAYLRWWRAGFVPPPAPGRALRPPDESDANRLQGQLGSHRRGHMDLVRTAIDGTPRGARGPDDRSLFPTLGPVALAALFHGVRGAPLAPTDPTAWEREADVLVRHRIAGLALAAAAESGVDLPADTAARLHESQVRLAARALGVDATAMSVLEMLSARSVPFVVTKGPGIAATYPQPAFRPYGDLDVLVPPERFGEAMLALVSAGFEEYFDAGEPRPYFDRYCREGVNLIRGDGGSIDLHHRIPPWVWGVRLDFSRLADRSRQLEIAGGSMPVLDPAHNLLVAALHVISDRRVHPGYKLLTWRDLVSLAAASDPATIVREARDARLDWYLAFILRQLPTEVLPTSVLQQLGEAPAGRADAFRLRRLTPPAIGSRHQIAQIFRLPVPNAVAFLTGYVFPSRGFLARRYGQEGSYRRWWMEATDRLLEARESAPAEAGQGR